MKHIIPFILLSFLASSCNSPKTEQQETTTPTPSNMVVLTQAQYKNAGIETGKLENRTLSSVLTLNGKIEVPPQNMVSISVPLGGYLASTHLLPGAPVRKGEIIAVVEDPQYIQLQQDYLTAKAQYAYQESEYHRQKELNESKTASDKAFEQAKATYQAQQVLIKSLEQKLKLIGVQPEKITANTLSKSIPIRSPITGFVAAVNANIGKYINPSDVLFELVNPSDVHLMLTVFDKDLNQLSIGQKVYAYTNTQPDKKYPGEIILISKNVTTDNATQVHCHFEQYDKSLLPGMFMNAIIELTGTVKPSLPDAAIVQYENKHYVFVQKADRQFEMVEVNTGNQENGYTEIINVENMANSTFVTKGAYQLLMVLKNSSDEEE